MSEEVQQQAKRFRTAIDDARGGEMATSSHQINKATYAEFNISSSNFADIVQTRPFVDKTLLIKAIFQDAPIILITVPRVFGKSTNMNMVKKFVEIEVDEKGNKKTKRQQEEIIDDTDNYNLFADNNLKIIEETDIMRNHFGKHPVIYVSFSCVQANYFEGVLDELRYVLNSAFKKHKCLLECNELWTGNLGKQDKNMFMKYCSIKDHENLTDTEVEGGLKFLSSVLHKHFNKKVFVLIDECDTPIISAIFTKNSQTDKIVRLINGLISNSVTENDHVDHVLISACVHLSGALSADANNFQHHAFLKNHPFSEFYGLTGSEVEGLLGKFKMINELEEVRTYFGGYKVLDKNIEIYSTWSIVNYLRTKKINNYWVYSAGLNNLKKMFSIDEIREVIEKLISNETVTVPYVKNLEVEDIQLLKNLIESPIDNLDNRPVDLFVRFLYENGYLNLVDSTNDTLTLQTPNKQITQEFENEVHFARLFPYKRIFHAANVNAFTSALGSLSLKSDQNKITVTKLATAVKNLFPVLPNNGFEFHAPLFTIASNKFKITMGQRYVENKKRHGILIIREDSVAIILELKYNNQSSKEALEQILSCKYYEISDVQTEKNITGKILIGLHMDQNRKVTVGYLVNNYNINEAVYVSSN